MIQSAPDLAGLSASSAAALAYQRWSDGDIDERLALRAMTAALDAAERQIAQHEGQRALWRRRIQEVVEQLGGKYALDRYGEFRVTERYEVVTYDRKAIDELAGILFDAGDHLTAKRLRDARRVSERPPMLQIRRFETKKGPIS